MLIEKDTKPTVGDIVVARLTTGEEVIGRLVGLPGGRYDLTRPRLVHVQLDEQNRPQIGLLPFLYGADADAPIRLREDAMMTLPAKARADIEALWTRSTTPLTVPQKPSLIV